MNRQVSSYLSLISQSLVLILGVAIPFFFWNLTSEFYETPKFLLLITLTVILLVLWAGRWLVEGKITFTRTPLDIPFLLVFISFILSTALAPARSIAILGNFPRIHGGFAAFATYIALYFILTSNIKELSMASRLRGVFIFSGIVLSILSLLAFAGVNFLGFPWTEGPNFTPTGSSFSTAALLTLTLPFLLITILQGSWNELTGNIRPDIISKIATTAILTLFLATLTLTGSFAILAAVVATFGLALFVSPMSSIRQNLPLLAIPIAIATLLMFLSFSPIGSPASFLSQKAQNFPRELQLNIGTSWKISISAFRDSPFWGSGPGSYLFDFTAYKPLEFNNGTTWNVRFDQAFNEYLQVLATLGIIGLIAFLLLASVFISLAFKVLISSKDSLALSFAISGIIFFVLLALHPSTLPLWVMGIMVLAAFMAINKNLSKQIHIGTAAAHPETHLPDGPYLHLDILPTASALIVIFIGGFALYSVGKVTLADYHRRLALNAISSGQGLVAYNELVAAESLSPNVDLYRTDLAQTNFALANAIATAKGPTESSPSGSLNDADKQNIQTLLSQAINEAKVATTLSPNNPANWEILGSIYRQISGVAQNALVFSLDSYGRAVARDPYNPLLRLTVGGIYYSARNYDMAVRFFSDAINLKPDYANAYYNLAVALRDKGDLNTAAASAEKTISLLEPNASDYKTAADLLSSIKDQIASEGTKQKVSEEKIEPLAAQTNSALQDQKLPKVLDLPQPEKIATPPAVKKQEE